MNKQSILIYFIITLCLSSCSENYEIIRLLEQSRVDDICSKDKLNFISESLNDTVTEYMTKLSQKLTSDTDVRNTLIDFMFKGETSGYLKLIKTVALYIVTLILAIIALITWVSLLCCCCCTCCCFKKDSTSTCGKMNYVFSIIVFGLIIILTIVSFTQSSSFVTYFTGSSCSFLRFFDHALYGDGQEKAPKWIGVNGLTKTLSATIVEVQNMTQKTSGAFKNLDKLKINDGIYSNHIQESKEYYAPLKGPSTQNEIYPIWAYQYQDETKLSLTLGKINAEYKIVIKPVIALMSELFTDTTVLTKETDAVVQSLENVKGEVQALTDMVDSIYSKVSDAFVTTLSKIIDYLLLSFQILFGALIGFSALSIALLSLYLCSKCSLFKCCLHLLWNFLILFIACCFIIGTLLGLIGSVSQQMVPVLSYVLSDTYLNSNESIFYKNSTATKLLEECINGKGDLAKVIGIGSTKADILKSFYEVSNKLTNFTDSIELLNNSKALPEAKAMLIGYQNDYSISTDSSYGNDDVTESLNALTKLTDKNMGSSCDTQDQWTSTKTKCINGYTYLAPSATKQTGVKYCLLISDWDNSKVEEFYTGCGDQSSIVTRYDSINQYVVSHQNTISKMISRTDKMDELYGDMAKDVKSEFHSLNDVISTAIKLFGTILGDSSFYDMFNCSFIRRDLINFFDQFFNHFASSSIIVSYVCLACALISYIGVFFLIRALYTSSENNRSVNEYQQNTYTKPLVYN